MSLKSGKGPKEAERAKPLVVDSGRGVSDPYAARVLEDYLCAWLWKFAHNLMLGWLKDNERVEPWFVLKGIDSVRHLGRTILRLSDHPELARESRDWIEDLLVDIEAVADGHLLDGDRTFEVGVGCLERATLRLQPGTARHARALHLIAFLHRVDGNEGRRSAAMARMERCSTDLADFENHYALRLEYERACKLRYGAGQQPLDRSAADTLAAAEGFDRAARLAEVAKEGPFEAPRPVAHILFGSLRAGMLCRMDVGDHVGALQGLEFLLDRFAGADSRYFPYDPELIAAAVAVEPGQPAQDALRSLVYEGLRSFAKNVEARFGQERMAGLAAQALSHQGDDPSDEDGKRPDFLVQSTLMRGGAVVLAPELARPA